MVFSALKFVNKVFLALKFVNTVFLAWKFVNTAFLSQKFVKTRSSIALKDLLRSSITPQIKLVCLLLASIHCSSPPLRLLWLPPARSAKCEQPLSLAPASPGWDNSALGKPTSTKMDDFFQLLKAMLPSSCQL